MKYHLELFSGTHSFGKVTSKNGYTVISLDKYMNGSCPWTDYNNENHIKEDILTFDYKKYDKNKFDLITASPVCTYWSRLRNCWIGRKCKSIHPTDIITKEILENEINTKGKPQVDKIFEIIDYFKPKKYIIENPSTGKMKFYIAEKYSKYNKFYDVDYCKYSDFGYKKTSRFYTNIENFKPKKCKSDCDNLILHENRLVHRLHFGDKKRKGCVGGGNNRLNRFRIPSILIKDMLN